MAKWDYICGICKKVKGSNWGGNPTEQYRCTVHKKICRDCVTVRGGIFSRTVRTCNECNQGVLLYEYDEKKKRWEQS